MCVRVSVCARVCVRACVRASNQFFVHSRRETAITLHYLGLSSSKVIGEVDGQGK